MTCQLCGKDHTMADRTCKAKYKTPFLVKKLRWEKARQEKEDGYYTAQERPSNANIARDRSESFPRLPQERKSRSRSRSRARSQSRSHLRAKEPQNSGAAASLQEPADRDVLWSGGASSVTGAGDSDRTRDCELEELICDCCGWRMVASTCPSDAELGRHMSDSAGWRVVSAPIGDSSGSGTHADTETCAGQRLRSVFTATCPTMLSV
ncbi:hypothetical protein HPB50_014129 [Hyalomma asiaticum]|uniref:Uncharacterized protein n=1 Tax=Hyalomma asiaticum TaxID=266040 RepID=A0ACB7TK44_HYAAI|nr:hypothetical protein HPB50_014129 [Hyalomma asiaticum]